MSAENDLLDGIAAALAACGAGTYRPDTDYVDGETAIVFDDMPATPDRCIVLTTYGNANDAPNMALGTVMLQVRTRGVPDSPRDVRDLAGKVFDILHGLTHQQYGTAHANEILRRSSIPMGQDSAQRWERSDNYAIELDTPPTALRPE